jgi:hypothetical protein
MLTLPRGIERRVNGDTCGTSLCDCTSLLPPTDRRRISDHGHGLDRRQGRKGPMSAGSIAMSLSTIIVAANARLLRRLHLQPASTNDAGLAKSGAAIPT